MSRHLALIPRAHHPPRWALVLLSLSLMVGVVLLFQWLNVQDEANRVANNPAGFARPRQEMERLAEPEPRQPEPSRPQAAQPVLVTELTQLLEAPSQEALLGRQVVLDGVPVHVVPLEP